MKGSQYRRDRAPIKKPSNTFPTCQSFRCTCAKFDLMKLQKANVRGPIWQGSCQQATRLSSSFEYSFWVLELYATRQRSSVEQKSS